MLFLGDTLFPGDNDSPAKQAGVMSTRVADAEETKQAIGELIESMNDDHLIHFTR